MKNFLIKMLIFTLIFFAICIGIHFLFLKGFRLQNNTWNNLFDGKINADIIILGSSRALEHFDCIKIEEFLQNKSVYNLGMNGVHIELQLPFFQSYLKHNKKPDLLIIPLDIFSFSPRKEPNNPVQYCPYLYQENLYNNLILIYPLFKKLKYIPLYGLFLDATEYRKNVINGFLQACHLIPSSDTESRIKGYLPKNLEWDSRFDEFKQEHPHGISYKIDKSSVKYHSQLLDICKANNISAILVYPPEYYENKNLTLNRTEIFDKFNELATQYNIPFWDYSDLPITRDTSYFFNSQHMNIHGVEVFMDQFIKDFKDYINNKQ